MGDAILNYYQENKDIFDKLVDELSKLIPHEEQFNIDSINIEIFSDKSAGLYLEHTDYSNQVNNYCKEVANIGLENADTSLH
jgi:adenosylmethionine-8-amino-7-oxononanoate aminotransferase